GRVDHVALAAGDIAQVAGIQEPASEARLERVENRAPVDPRRLHADQRHAQALKPVGKRLQPAKRRGEAARLLLALPPALGRHAYGRHHAVAVYIQTGAALNENVHLLPPSGRWTGCRPEGPPEYESEVRARGSSQLFRRPPHHASTRARSVKYDRRCTGTAPRFSSTRRCGRTRRHRLLPANYRQD